MAPAIALLLKSLASSGLGLIGNAVLAKGKDFVEDKLGVDLEQAMGTEQGRIRLQEIQAEREEDLHAFVLAQRDQELKAEQMAYQDTANSRDANARIQESANAAWLAKNTGYVIDFVIIGATLLMSGMLMFRAIPLENREQAFAVWGALMALCGTVVQWHRGSSSGSQRKTDELAALAGKRP